MIVNDHQLGKPFVQYTGTQAAIEALTGLDEGSTAYATDINQLGSYDGAVWTWGGGSIIVPINIYNETQTADGTNTIYYLTNYAAPGTIRVYIDGVRQPASDDVAPSDTVIFSVAPDAGAVLLFDYEMDQT